MSVRPFYKNYNKVLCKQISRKGSLIKYAMYFVNDMKLLQFLIDSALNMEKGNYLPTQLSKHF